ncbi:MAG: endonuclease MutS2 [Firmicutes bacterium]|nr:endonuclease MutS2 [Bacillota bacterium]
MFERAVKTLEFNKIISKVEEYAATVMGKELVRELRPLTDLTAIREAQQITSEAVQLLTESDRVPLGGVFDIRDSLKKASIGGILTAQELLEIGSTLRGSRLMREFLTGTGNSLTILPEWGGRLAVLPGLEKELERCLGPEGEVLDSASPKLRSLRSQLKVYQNRVRDKLESIVKSSENSKYLQEPIVSIRNDRYVIPVKQEYRALFPGIVHDQSASGATLFIEPLAVVELNNQLRIIEAETVEEVNRILKELSGKVKEIADQLRTALDILARLDLAFAKGRYSLNSGGVEPLLNSDGEIKLLNAKHPLLTGEVVPITVSLGEAYHTLVITGPNTGGKTVTLKTIGLLTLMAQSGLHIPADSGSKIAVFNKVFCDIGDEQSIEQSLSTFSSHLTQIVKIIEGATGPDCLVLLDELGAGTDPTEGAALAMSILTHLHQLEVRTVATTHYSELKAFAYKTEGICNAAVEFDIETLRPTYRLLTGLPGSSQAFEIALKLGLPEFLVRNARSYISAEEAKVEEMLKQIEIDRKKARQDRMAIEADRQKIEKDRRRYEEELAKFQREKEELLRQARLEAREVLLEARRESENLLRRLRESPPEQLTEIVNTARQKIGAELESLEAKTTVTQPEGGLKAEDLRVGMRVKSRSLDQTGTVLEIGNGEAVVQMGVIKANLAVGDLEPVAEEKVKPARPLRKSGTTGLETAQKISAEISLRGMTIDEGLYQLDKYFDQAIMAGLNRFRVIHGKGTGALRKAVHQYLKENPMVKSFAFAEQNEGGLGATVVELKR